MFLDRMPFERVQWLLPLVVTLHNMEEASGLPKWSRNAGRWHPPVGTRAFRFAIVIVTGALYLITLASVRGGRESRGAYLFSGTTFMMLLNVFIPHAAATVLLRRYAPGVVTGVLLNLPTTVYLLRRAFREQYISAQRFRAAMVLVPLATAALLPVLFRAGRRLDRAASSQAAPVIGDRRSDP